MKQALEPYKDYHNWVLGIIVGIFALYVYNEKYGKPLEKYDKNKVLIFTMTLLFLWYYLRSLHDPIVAQKKTSVQSFGVTQTTTMGVPPRSTEAFWSTKTTSGPTSFGTSSGTIDATEGAA